MFPSSMIAFLYPINTLLNNTGVKLRAQVLLPMFFPYIYLVTNDKVGNLCLYKKGEKQLSDLVNVELTRISAGKSFLPRMFIL